MKIRTLLVIVCFLALFGCGSSNNTASSAVRSYNGTASVGDFLNITIDPVAHTLHYTNASNGDSGTVPYTVNADGTYAIQDPTGNLLSAYEVPNYALLIQAAKTGPNHNTPALITAVESGQISLATWSGKSFNYMQFRTAAGGLEVGTAVIDANGGTVTNSSYWPYGAVSQGNSFNQGIINITSSVADPSGTFLKINEGNNQFDYVFGTANGVFAVDTPNGAILALQKAASKNFDPSYAGTYKAIFYQKTGATTGIGNVETGTPSMSNATIVVGSAGQITIQDQNSNTIAQSTLTAVADTPYLYGSPNELTDPCNGLFTFRITTANSQQDVFVSFLDRSALFSSFTATLPWGSGNTYDYMYGVGIK